VIYSDLPALTFYQPLHLIIPKTSIIYIPLPPPSLHCNLVVRRVGENIAAEEDRPDRFVSSRIELGAGALARLVIPVPLLRYGVEDRFVLVLERVG